MSKFKYIAIYLFLSIMVTADPVNGTTITMVTNLGNIDVELFDDIAPKTVANFLHYVNNGGYTNTIIHRSVPGFIIQGGGFIIGENTIYTIPANSPVENEFNISNKRGTLAMAKLGGDPDSATTQWFFSLSDNASILDDQNGGFTVFGQALEASMNVVDTIAGLSVFDASENLGSAFEELPLLDNSLIPQNIVTISGISVTVGAGPEIGDIDGDGNVDLVDAILALKALTAVNPFSSIPETADVNGDGKIGFEEAMYTLQVTSGIRLK
jgi:cyclophilin family peptidyl-prolyl cis-trans isomerase